MQGFSIPICTAALGERESKPIGIIGVEVIDAPHMIVATPLPKFVDTRVDESIVIARWISTLRPYKRAHQLRDAKAKVVAYYDPLWERYLGFLAGNQRGGILHRIKERSNSEVGTARLCE